MEKVITSITEELIWAIPLLLFLSGAALGSYYITYLSRYKAGMTRKEILNVNKKGACFCFTCKARLTFKDMVPIYNYIRYLGKCKYCGVKIGSSTIVIELGVGTVFLVFGFWMVSLL